MDRTCTIEGCGKTLLCKGVCAMHYQRLRINGKADIPPRPRRLCNIEDCGRPLKGGGYCNMHYGRYRAHGDPNEVKIERMRGGLPTYAGAHSRVRTLWGAASKQTCVECGGAAAHWAYDGTDPSEMQGRVNGKSGLFKYSQWPEFYMPMCASCHKLRDVGLAAQELAEYRAWKAATGMTIYNLTLPDSYMPTVEEERQLRELCQTQ